MPRPKRRLAPILGIPILRMFVNLNFLYILEKELKEKIRIFESVVAVDISAIVSVVSK
jgi:hypothetical protein